MEQQAGKEEENKKTLSDLSTHPHAAHTRQKGEEIEDQRDLDLSKLFAISGNCQM